MSTLIASIQYCPGGSWSKIVRKDNKKERKGEDGERESKGIYKEKEVKISFLQMTYLYI